MTDAAAPPGSDMRAEAKVLGGLAIPIVITQLSQMGFGLVDAVMAGRVGAVHLAGVGLGSNLYWPLMLLLMGLMMSVTPLVSQLDGAGKRHETGAIVRQALWIAIPGGIAGMLLLRNARVAYEFLGVDPAALPVALPYLDLLSWGLIPVLGFFAFRYLCEGLSWTKPAMLIVFSALCLKIALNSIFVFGAFGYPAEGGVGCGRATMIVMWYELAVMLLVVGNSRIRSSGVLDRFDWPDPAVLGRILRLGLPIGVTVFAEVSFFSGVSLLIGRLGVEAVASHQIAMNVGGIGFMIPMALSTATTIRVGFNVGSGDVGAARRSAGVGVGAALSAGFVAACLLLVLRHEIASLYTDEATVMRTAANLLLLCALYQVFDAGQAVGVGALRGYKDTRTPMIIALCSYWGLGLPAGGLLTFGAFDTAGLGVYGFWWGLVIGLAAAAVILLTRVRRLSVREDRVRQLAGL